MGLDVRGQVGMSVIDVLIAATILLVIVFSAANVFRDTLRLNSSIDYSSRAWSIATQEMEALKHMDFNWLYNVGRYYYAFNENSEITASTSRLLERDLGKSSFNSMGLRGSTTVYLDKVRRNSGDFEDAFLLATVVVCYREAKGRVVGEDTNLNGRLDRGEDKNRNDRIDSPILLKGVVYDI